MTVPEHARIDRHVENPIGIGKSTSHDAHDGDDDELQRFSKGVAALFLEMRDHAMGGNMGEHKAVKERCRCEARSAYFFQHISCCSYRVPYPALS
jgi:hypothetical protein